MLKNQYIKIYIICLYVSWFVSAIFFFMALFVLPSTLWKTHETHWSFSGELLSFLPFCASQYRPRLYFPDLMWRVDGCPSLVLPEIAAYVFRKQIQRRILFSRRLVFLFIQFIFVATAVILEPNAQKHIFLLHQYYIKVCINCWKIIIH